MIKYGEGDDRVVSSRPERRSTTDLEANRWDELTAHDTYMQARMSLCAGHSCFKHTAPVKQCYCAELSLESCPICDKPVWAGRAFGVVECKCGARIAMCESRVRGYAINRVRPQDDII